MKGNFFNKRTLLDIFKGAQSLLVKVLFAFAFRVIICKNQQSKQNALQSNHLVRVSSGRVNTFVVVSLINKQRD